MPAFKKDSLFVQSKRQVSCELDGEVVILNHGRGIYYGLDAVGTEIWGLLKKPHRMEEIQNILLQNYEVERTKLKQDLTSLLRRMVAEGLVTVSS